MKLFRLRFVLLGLLLCVCNVWSLSCRTEFDDPASKAYQSQIALIGKVSQILPPVNNVYNITIKISNKRDIYKGEQLLKKGRRSRVGLITVGPYGAEDADHCVANVQQDSQYFFFLNSTTDSKFFTNSRMPVSSADKKYFKKAKKDVKKILKCSGTTCVKVPVIDSRRALKDKSVRFGKNIELNCKIRRTTYPLALFKWFKDGLEIKHKSFKGLSIRTGKKGSRLKKSRANLSDQGTYECIVKNVGGEIKQVSVISISGVQPPVASGTMKTRKQKFGGTLKLTCRVKGVPRPNFRWFKDGKELKNGDSRGLLAIKTRGSESRLRKERVGLPDGGQYYCLAENVGGNTTQKFKVNITNAPNTISSTTDIVSNRLASEGPPISTGETPQKTRPCDKKDKNYCLNNGTCNIMVELNQKFCTCRTGYKGDRCLELDLRFDKAREQKLAQDRTIVVVGIISGILLFIGICVASYFLAKRRRDRFYRRRNEKARHIEDIPQVYRPLPACDDVDGSRKHFKQGVVINQETQTIETCFLPGTQEDPKLNLYINPLEGYVRPNREERNSRSRLTAVSLDGAQRSSAPNSLERNKRSSGDNNPDRSNYSPNRQNGPNPQRVPSERENSQPNGARVRAESPNSGSVNPPAFNLETDSEDEILSEETPLTPLHISEDDDTLRRRREREQNDRNVSTFPHPRDSSNDSNYSNPPSYTTALAEDDKENKYNKLDRSNSNDRIYASTSPSSSDSSSTTEGCDSPNTMNQYEFSLSDPEMNTPYWNERESAEPNKDSPPPYKPVPKYDYTPVYANHDKHASNKPDRIGNFNRNDNSLKHIPFFK